MSFDPTSKNFDFSPGFEALLYKYNPTAEQIWATFNSFYQLVKQGDLPSMVKVHEIVMDHQDVLAEHLLTVQIFLGRAAIQGNLDAQKRLREWADKVQPSFKGYIYIQYYRGILYEYEKNEQKAIECYDKIIESGQMLQLEQLSQLYSKRVNDYNHRETRKRTHTAMVSGDHPVLPYTSVPTPSRVVMGTNQGTSIPIPSPVTSQTRPLSGTSQVPSGLPLNPPQANQATSLTQPARPRATMSDETPPPANRGRGRGRGSRGGRGKRGKNTAPVPSVPNTLQGTAQAQVTTPSVSLPRNNQGVAPVQVAQTSSEVIEIPATDDTPLGKALALMEVWTLRQQGLRFLAEWKQKKDNALLDKAKYLFNKGMTTFNCVFCKYQVGKLLLKNEDEEQRKKGIQFLNQASKEGCKRAYNLLGKIYEKGVHVSKDLNAARQYYLQALRYEIITKDKNATPFYNEIVVEDASICYPEDREKKILEVKGDNHFSNQEYKEAIEIFQKLPDSLYASYKLGDMFFRGLGCEIDKIKAFCYFADVVTKSESTVYLRQAQYKLGLCYSKGDEGGIRPNKDLALELFENATKKYEHKLSAYQAGLIYEHDKKNLAKAFELYKFGAKIGSYRCMLAVADMYFTGTGTPKDSFESLSWYDKVLTGETPGQKDIEDALIGKAEVLNALAVSLRTKNPNPLKEKITDYFKINGGIQK